MNSVVIDFMVIRSDNNVTRNTFPKSKRTFCRELITSFVLKGIYWPCFCHFAAYRQLRRQTRTVQEHIYILELSIYREKNYQCEWCIEPFTVEEVSQSSFNAQKWIREIEWWNDALISQFSWMVWSFCRRLATEVCDKSSFNLSRRF